MTHKDLVKGWVYVRDQENYSKADVWKFLTPDSEGKFVGDCEDFALTWLAITEGSALKAVWSLMTGRRKLWYVLTKKGEGHAVLQMGKNIYVDNWSRRETTRKFMESMGHDFQFVISRRMLLRQLIKGLFA